MGQTLSEPRTEKHSESDGNSKMFYGLSCMQGWRWSMEDAHTALLQLPGTDKEISFFAVFDGHGGEKIAIHAGDNRHKNIVSTNSFKSLDNGVTLQECLKESFFALDEAFKKVPELKDDPSGCTAVTCAITNNEIICANSGDSRCIISLNGTVKPLSYDHKPTLETERERISNAGGFVEFGRVNGNLALSRAFGDFEFKKNHSLPPEEQIVTVDPEIITHAIDNDLLFIVLACDGIWDCMSNQEVVDFIQNRIAEGKDLSLICEEIIDFCLAPEATLGAVGCDNMSIIIIGFLNGMPKEKWVEKCRENLSATAAEQKATEKAAHASLEAKSP